VKEKYDAESSPTGGLEQFHRFVEYKYFKMHQKGRRIGIESKMGEEIKKEPPDLVPKRVGVRQEKD